MDELRHGRVVGAWSCAARMTSTGDAVGDMTKMRGVSQNSFHRKSQAFLSPSPLALSEWCCWAPSSFLLVMPSPRFLLGVPLSLTTTTQQPQQPPQTTATTTTTNNQQPQPPPQTTATTTTTTTTHHNHHHTPHHTTTHHHTPAHHNPLTTTSISTQTGESLEPGQGLQSACSTSGPLRRSDNALKLLANQQERWRLPHTEHRDEPRRGEQEGPPGWAERFHKD